MTRPSGSWRDAYYEDGYLRRWALPPAGRAEVERAAAYVGLSRVSPGALVLDLGCGHGRYSIPLATLGYRVCGLDGSWTLLRRARADAAHVQPRIWWVRADMRALPIHGSFDLALLLDSFGYFDADGEDVAFLRHLREVLAANGRLLMRNPNATVIRSRFRPVDREVREGAVTRIRSHLCAGGRWLHQDVVVEQAGSIHAYERSQRIYSADELDDVVDAGGFSVLGHYADAAGRSFEPRHSPHVVTVCTPS